MSRDRHSSLTSSSSRDKTCYTPTTHDDDVFQASPSLLENQTFKIHAKVISSVISSDCTRLNQQNAADNTDSVQEGPKHHEFSIPKSDSINIFSVKSDPFDDDFFK